MEVKSIYQMPFLLKTQDTVLIFSNRIPPKTRWGCWCIWPIEREFQSGFMAWDKSMDFGFQIDEDVWKRKVLEITSKGY